MALSEEHKVMVEVIGRLPGDLRSSEAVPVGKIRVGFEVDDLRQLVVASFIANGRFGLRVKMATSPGGATEADAITALIAAVIKNHAEIRDALAESD